MELRTAIDEFIEDRESYGRTPNTLKFYHSQLGRFASFLEERKITKVSGIDRSALRAFFAGLYRREVSEGTVSAYDRALRTFLKFCEHEEWIEADPMRTRDRIRPPERLPDTWTLDEIEQILATCGSAPSNIRDRTIILLLLDTGLRAGELCALEKKDVTLEADRGLVTVWADGSKSKNDRIVPFWSETAAAIDAWLGIVPAEAKTLFVSCNHHQELISRPLTTGGLYQMLRRRVDESRVGRKKRLSHIWRHTFAKFYVMAGGDLESLRRMLGHKSLETVRIYLGFRTQDIADRHFDLSPVRSLVEKQKLP